MKSNCNVQLSVAMFASYNAVVGSHLRVAAVNELVLVGVFVSMINMSCYVVEGLVFHFYDFTF